MERLDYNGLVLWRMLRLSTLQPGPSVLGNTITVGKPTGSQMLALRTSLTLGSTSHPWNVLGARHMRYICTNSPDSPNSALRCLAEQILI